MNRSAILCVDDEPIILLSLKHELMDHFGDRYVYETASTAEKALEIIEALKTEQIDIRIVISDWLMPGMNGDEFLRILNASHPDIRCIVLSGQASREEIDVYLKNSNLAAYIEKPYSIQQIFNTIEEINKAKGVYV
jgi:DNA-binding NtrC family response regulator